MREPWDLSRDFVQMMANGASQDRAAGDNALMQIIASQLGRQNAATTNQYNVAGRAQQNEYAKEADTVAFGRQVQRDNTAYTHQDARRAEDRGWALEDDTRDFDQSKDLARYNQQMLAEREGFARGGVGPARRYSDGNAGGDLDAASVLRKFEGFRDTPYWDVNAFRVGYGSDTYTDPSGKAHRVDRGTRVTRDDAERDLARRAREFETVAARQVGGAWGNLPPNTRAALISTTYNYGSLPSNVVEAVRTGDTKQIAMAVASLSSHNGGINAKRRQQEAAIISGGGEGFIPDNGTNPRRYGEGGQDYADTILTNPTPNSAGSGESQFTPEAIQYASGLGKEIQGRVKLNESMLELLQSTDPATYNNIIPDITKPYDGNDAMYLITRDRPKPEADPNAPKGQVTQGPNVELKTNPTGRIVDGKLQLDQIQLPD